MKKNNFIEEKIEELLKFYTSLDSLLNEKYVYHISLFSGLSGIIVLLVDLKDSFSEIITTDILENFILKSFQILENQQKIYPSYCDGLAGYGFMLLKVKKSNIFFLEKHKDILAQLDSILEEIDEILDCQIEQDIIDDNFDLLHGLLGVGLYFLERGKINSLDIIVDKLINLAEINGSFCYWKKYESFRLHKTIIDLGYSHGNASNLYFLTKVASVLNDKSLNFIITRIIDFYLSTVQEKNDEIISYFPHVINHDEYMKKENLPENSRLAWCYGDIGILYGLYISSVEINDIERSNIIYKMLIDVAGRKEDLKEYILDSGFCHGFSGLAIMFKNLFFITLEETFNKTSDYWMNEMKNYNYMRTKSNKHNNLITEYFDTENVTLLEGLAGVLYSYCKQLEIPVPITDEILLLKY